MPERVPPGRAGRLWLRDRLETTTRSAELLDHKRQLMRRELAILESTRIETEAAFKTAFRSADRWGLRATALGGAADVALAAAAVVGRTRVEVTWRNTMGVVYPVEPRCTPAVLAPLDAAGANAATAQAAALYRAALEAALRHGVADTACRALRGELLATERRLRAIQHFRIPALEDDLRRLELQLDEIEREERVVTRWAKQRRDEQRAAPGV
jgi:V/A-type H+-transporting ATPase subunit D